MTARKRKAPRRKAPAATPAAYRLSLVAEPTPPEYGVERFGCPADAAKAAAALLAEEPAEVVGAFLLDTRRRPIGHVLPYRGTLTRAACEPRGFLLPAYLANAHGLLLFHNHPSGDPEPSADDLAFTRRVAQAAELLGVALLDHVIIGAGGRWQSLQKRGFFPCI